MTDPIANMLTRIRNAVAAKQTRVDIPSSKLKLEMARILKEEGYISNFVLKGEGLKRTIRIFLPYDKHRAARIKSLALEAAHRERASSRQRALRKVKEPEILFPKQASRLGKEKIEAAVIMNFLKSKGSREQRKAVTAEAE